MEKQLKAARAAVAKEAFGTPAFDAAIAKVRAITSKMMADAPKEEFCSIDSGVHRTRLASGKIV